VLGGGSKHFGHIDRILSSTCSIVVSSLMMAVHNRLNKEYKEIQKSLSIHNLTSPDLADIYLQPVANISTGGIDLFNWLGHIIGPVDTPFDGGKFELKLVIPRDYPIHPPKVTFLTKICHPNIHFKSGEICLDILKDAWTPIWTLEATLRAIQALLGNPEADSPLNCDAGNLVRAGDLLGYNSLARMYTLEYAKIVRKSKMNITNASSHNTTPSNTTNSNNNNNNNLNSNSNMRSDAIERKQ
jgi:peroxin-4